MGISIVITSGKGGVGKTTTTANIGAALAMMGKKVVMIDGDTGLRNLDVLLGLENRVVYTLTDVIDKKCTLKKALIKDRKAGNLFLLPTAQTKDKDYIKPEHMKKIVADLKKDYDYVLIDCPAGIEQGFQNSIVAADEALVVVNPELTSIRDADRVIGKLEAGDIEKYKLIINRINFDMAQKGDMLNVEDVVEVLSIPLIGVVPMDTNVTISTNKGEPIVLNETAVAGIAYKDIARRILGEEVPFTKPEENIGFWDKIKRLFKKQGGK